MRHDPRQGWAEGMEAFIKNIMGTQTALLEVMAHLVLQAQDVPGEHEAAGDESYEAVEKKLKEATMKYRKARENFLAARCDWEKIADMDMGPEDGEVEDE